MNAAQSKTIVPGIRLDSAGQASVDAAMGERLIELAIELESYTNHPVDVQHVLAAIIQAANNGDLVTVQALPKTDARLCKMLARHVDEIFSRFAGKVSAED